jgi:phage virion morphogenesis protein
MSDISINIDNAELNRLFKELENKVQNPTEALRNVGEYMLGSIDIGFQQEIDPDGVPWQPNSPFTIAEKQRLGRIQKILQSTGAMRSRYNYRVEGRTLKVGNSDPKAVKHQLGIGVPVRKHLGIRKEDPDNIAEILRTYIEG